MKQLLENIRQIRRERGMTQASFATDLGIEQSHYSRIENGTLEMSVPRLMKICEIFNISISELENYHQAKEYKSPGEGGDLQANESLIAYIKQEEEKIEGIYKEALENKNDYIKMLQEQRDFYKTQYEQAKDLLKKQTAELEKQLGLVEEANKLIDKFSAKG